jgi:putative MATE family efflux protein
LDAAPRPLHPPGRRISGRIRVTAPASIGVVLALALPSLVEQILQAVIGLTDTIIAGHTGPDSNAHAAAAAAVGTMSYLQWFTGLMVAALGVGATAIVARSIGASRVRVANRVAGTALTAAFVVGLGTAVMLFAFASQIVWLCGLRGLAAEYGTQYLRIMTITIALQTMGQIGMACLRGSGDTFRPMLITGGVALLNLVSSSTLTFGWLGMPEMGIRGNALGTLLAFLVGGIATLALLLGGWAGLKLRWRHIRIVPHVLRRILRIGAPSWAEGFALWIGQFMIVIFVIAANDAALGVDGATMAAHAAVLRIESIAFLPGFGFGIAASALVGQYLGAGKPQESRRAALLANRLAVVTMTVAAIPMMLFPHFLLGLLVDSPTVVASGKWPMILAGAAQPGFAVAIVFGSALKGAGETIWPMVSTIGGMFVIRVPILIAALIAIHYFGHPGMGLTAVWIAVFGDLNAKALFNAWVFFRGKWLLKKV